MTYEAEQYVVANWRAKLNFDKVLRQIAATFCRAANSSCKLRQHFAGLQTLPANCGNILQGCKLSLQIAAAF